MFAYHADGKRYQRVATGINRTNFYWDGENVVMEGSTTGTSLARYEGLPQMWGDMFSQRSSSGSSFPIYDPQSSARVLTGPSGTVTDTYVYGAFGDELASSGTTPNPFRFGGQIGYYRENSTRLYVRARWYRSELGLWLSGDPIGFDGMDWNLYRYVENNPVGNYDPGGLAKRICALRPPPQNNGCGSNQQSVSDAVTGLRRLLGKDNGLSSCVNDCMISHGAEASDAKSRVNCLAGMFNNFKYKCISDKECYKHTEIINTCATMSGTGTAFTGTCNVYLCARVFTDKHCLVHVDKTGDLMVVIFHEMMHCCGKRGDFHGSFTQAISRCVVNKCLNKKGGYDIPNDPTPK